MGSRFDAGAVSQWRGTGPAGENLGHFLSICLILQAVMRRIAVLANPFAQLPVKFDMGWVDQAIRSGSRVDQPVSGNSPIGGG
jgi:hypothetical protein